MLLCHSFSTRKKVWSDCTFDGWLAEIASLLDCILHTEETSSTVTLTPHPSPFQFTSFHQLKHTSSAGVFKPSMRARNRVGIGLSYRPARLHRLAELVPWNRFLGSLKFKNSGSGSILLDRRSAITASYCGITIITDYRACWWSFRVFFWRQVVDLYATFP